LRSAYSKAEFLFPSVQLRPGDSYTVYTQEAWDALGEEKEEERGKEEDGVHRAVWETPIVFSTSGDQAQLVSPGEEVVGSVEIIPVSNYTSTYKVETSEISISSTSHFTSTASASSAEGEETGNETQGEMKNEEEKKCVIM